MEELIVRHCAPTLAGMKAGSLFGYRFASRSSLLPGSQPLSRTAKGKGNHPLRCANTKSPCSHLCLSTKPFTKSLAVSGSTFLYGTIWISYSESGTGNPNPDPATSNASRISP